MLKLATVFSGIGAIEHALDRMQIEHEIVFACDNGDVELEMPQVSIDIDSMEKELKTLRAIIKKVSGKINDEESIDYASQLDFMLNGVETEYEKLIAKLAVDEADNEIIDKALKDTVAEIKDAIAKTTASKKKKYQELEKIYKAGFKKVESKLFFILRLGLTLEEDDFACSSEDIVKIFDENKKGAKRTVKSGRDISERLQMLHTELCMQTNYYFGE